MLNVGGAQPGEDLSFVVADLTADGGWTEAVAGADFVLHVASPFPATLPKKEDELIVPAREGALRVLRASRDGGVKRVVMTSSFAAIGYGQPATKRQFTEEDWTDVRSPRVLAYPKSKTLAERAAWDFIAQEGGDLELAVVNPVAVLGPALGPDVATSILIVKRMLEGSIPGCPRLSFGLVDVRDVADLHVRAMTHAKAKGERFIAAADRFLSMMEVATILKTHLGDAARRVPSRTIPDWILRMVALVDSEVAQLLPELGVEKNATHEKATGLLGWQPRSSEEAIMATAESLLRLGLVKS
jgi:nucleoside-diphosphate-sugar epimerase